MKLNCDNNCIKEYVYKAVMLLT